MSLHRDPYLDQELFHVDINRCDDSQTACHSIGLQFAKKCVDIQTKLFLDNGWIMPG